MNQEIIDLLIEYTMRDVLNIAQIAVIDGDATEKAQGIREGAAAILSKIETSGILGDVELTEEIREEFITIVSGPLLNLAGVVN